MGSNVAMEIGEYVPLRVHAYSFVPCPLPAINHAEKDTNWPCSSSV